MFIEWLELLLLYVGRGNGGSSGQARVAGIARMQSVGTILFSPVVAGRVVYFGSNDGYLYAVL
jgi:PQQ-like domain